MSTSDRPRYYIVWLFRPQVILFADAIERFGRQTMNEWHYNKVDGFRVKLTRQEASILKLSIPNVIVNRSKTLGGKRMLLPPPEMFRP